MMSTLQYIRVHSLLLQLLDLLARNVSTIHHHLPPIAPNPLSYFFYSSQSSYRTPNSPPTHSIPYLSQPSQSQTIPYQPNPSGNVHTRTVDRRPASHLSTGSLPPPYLNSQGLKKKKKRRDPINRHSYLPYLSIVPGGGEKEKKAQTLKVLGYITIKPPHRRSSNREPIVCARSGKAAARAWRWNLISSKLN